MMQAKKLPRTIVDSHVHLLDVQRLQYPWLAKVPDINRSYGTAEYHRATEDYNVAQYVCIEAAVAQGEARQEFDWLAGLSEADSSLAGIVAYADVSRGLAVRTELDYLASHDKLKGIRFTLGKAYQPNPKLCLEKNFIKGVRCLQKYGLAFDLAFDPSQAADMYEFARACPDIQLIINHTGKPDIAHQAIEPWRSAMQKLAGLPNVACKISDILRDSAGQTDPGLFRPFIDELVELFGIKRLAFGSDFPVVTMYGSYAEQLNILVTIFQQFSDSERQDFFCNNARRLYRLPHGEAAGRESRDR